MFLNGHHSCGLLRSDATATLLYRYGVDAFQLNSTCTYAYTVYVCLSFRAVGMTIIHLIFLYPYDCNPSINVGLF